MDQELTRRNIEPLFKDFYAAYDKEEFLLDADMEFSKIRKLLEKNPKVLRDDPVISLDYMKIIQLIKQTKLVEDTNEAFDAEASYARDWNDPEQLDRDLRDK